MPGIPSKDASFVWGTPRNYALTIKKALGISELRFTTDEENIYIYCRCKIFLWEQFLISIISAKMVAQLQKMELVSYVENKLGRKIGATYPSEKKFNIFKIILSGGRQ